MSTTASTQNQPEFFEQWDGVTSSTALLRNMSHGLFGTAIDDPGTDRYAESNTNTDAIVYFSNTKRDPGLDATVSKVEDVSVGDTYKTRALDPVRSIVKEFGKLDEGWDEPNSPVPSEDLIEDALVVLQNWPVLDLVPEPSIGLDGSIALELYDEDGFVLGGVEVMGERNAIYSIIDREEVIATGRFVTNSQTDMIKALSHFKDHLGK